MVFHWSLSDSKSPQVSRTLLSILTDLNNVVVWMVTTCPLISKSSSPFNNSSVTVPRAPITIGINVTFMFHSFFNSLASSKYQSFFSFSVNFTLRSAGTAKSTILQVLFLLLLLLIIIMSGRLAEIRWSVCMSKFHRSLCISSSRTFVGLCIYNLFVMVFYSSLSHSKSSQVSWTLPSILADLNNAVVWMVCARPPISNSSSPFSKLLGIVPSSPITTGITVTFMFHSFFSSWARSKYLSHCDPLRQQSLFFLLTVNCLVVWPVLCDHFVLDDIIANMRTGILAMLMCYFKLGPKAFEAVRRIREVERNDWLLMTSLSIQSGRGH